MSAASVVEKTCTMLVFNDKPSSVNEIKKELEGSDNSLKVEAMKKVINLMLAGEPLGQLFIPIVRYVLPSDDHALQKLLLLYMETISMTDAKGKLLPEMILICQNLRNNLQHPNEYLRGVTLRFLCRIKEEEILEPLIPSVLANLEHRHSYVRRYAVMALDAIFRLPKGDHLAADAPEIIERFLSQEQDLSARRNAFAFLTNHAPERAISYLMTQLDNVASWGDILQVSVLELIRKAVRLFPEQKGRYISIILSLLQSSSGAVVFECASTLTSLSQAPTAVRAAVQCYCQLLVSQFDNNVKLIVLDRVRDLMGRFRDIVQESLMDVLRALNSPNMDIRKKVLDIALSLVSPKNIDEVVAVLKKEIVKTQQQDQDKGPEYRQLLVQTVHQCALRFPDVASVVVPLLMDFLGDPSPASAMDVIYFVREIMETNAKLRVGVLQRLVDTFYQIRSSRVSSCALWIIAEYAGTHEDVLAAIQVIRAAVGPLPLNKTAGVQDEKKTGGEGDTIAPQSSLVSHRPTVLADGSYASQTAVGEQAFNSQVAASGIAPSVPNLRALLLSGDYFLGGVTSVTLAKLVLELRRLGTDAFTYNRVTAECMQLMAAILTMGQAGGAAAHQIDDDSAERISIAIQVLAAPTETLHDLLVSECRSAFAETLKERVQAREKEARETLARERVAQPDELLNFKHLKSKAGMTQLEVEDQVQTDLARATGGIAEPGKEGRSSTKTVALTGLSDPLFVEAVVNVHQYDILLDVSVTNRSRETLQNVTLELATMGDLKLVERPQVFTMAPGTSKQQRINIKVSSTETGVIFGNVVYETPGSYSDRHVVILSDIHIDVMDYISPASCSDALFRGMWAEFEWENKVSVSTNITEVQDFLDHIVRTTNMKCLTPPSALKGDCPFLAANLYAKSVFGEDALVNVSVERGTDGRIGGYIRIRSKTQGIALALGDKITLRMKSGSAGSA